MIVERKQNKTKKKKVRKVKGQTLTGDSEEPQTIQAKHLKPQRTSHGPFLTRQSEQNEKTNSSTYPGLVVQDGQQVHGVFIVLLPQRAAGEERIKRYLRARLICVRIVCFFL